MAITLQYRGPILSSNEKHSKKKNKHELRKAFHAQLKRLWANPPMDREEKWGQRTFSSLSQGSRIGQKEFSRPRSYRTSLATSPTVYYFLFKPRRQIREALRPDFMAHLVFAENQRHV